MADVSVLFPYKPDHGHRDQLFDWVKRRWLSLFPDVDLCVGETSDDPFNRSRSINLAAKKAKGDVFIVADTDTGFQPEAIREAVKAVQTEKTWVLPYRDYCKLDEETTRRLLKLDPSVSLTQEEFKPAEIQHGYVSGVVVLTREAFERVGGFDDRFQDWGGEDEAFYHALKTLWSKARRLESSVFHLWHKPARAALERDGQYLNNILHLMKYQKAEGSQLIMEILCRKTQPMAATKASAR